jgi:two-component system, cell cycle response regulator DivK
MSSKHILYIEDNFQNGRLVHKILTAKGYQVTVADDAKQGLALLETNAPDLILMDINMPGMDGKEATIHIKKSAHKHIPVIALTALAMRGDRESLLAAGCDDYLPKPLNMQQLLETVQRHLPIITPA